MPSSSPQSASNGGRKLAAQGTEDPCPIREADDKFTEAHYFIEQMMKSYHEPQPFRYNLNAFLQALRNVTFLLQKALRHHEGFDDLWLEQQDNMRGDALLPKFVEGRNIVVKERNLLMSSKAEIGFFRGRKLKLGVATEVATHVPSEFIVKEMAPKLGLIDEEHSAIGEQYGVRREWRAPELGTDDVLSLCDVAWSRIGGVLKAAHSFVGREFEAPPEHGHQVDSVNVLLETDIDPSLAEKWWG